MLMTEKPFGSLVRSDSRKNDIGIGIIFNYYLHCVRMEFPNPKSAFTKVDFLSDDTYA